MAPFVAYQPQPQPHEPPPHFTLGPRQNTAQPDALTRSVSGTSPPTTSHASGPSSGVVTGAVLGSIFGLVVLYVLWYKCCVNRRSVLWIPRYRYVDESGDGGFACNGNRGGEWERHHICRPDCAAVAKGGTRRVRTEQTEEMECGGGYRRISSAKGGIYKERTRRGRVVMTENRGILGWGFAKPQQKRHRGRRNTRRKRSGDKGWGSPVRGWWGQERGPVTWERGDDGLRFVIDG